MSTNTLTERYVHEVVRRVPADQRSEIADELRATIADTVEARGSADLGSAEREVLAEMGDPIRLAARYADRPLALIGPELYPTYVRVLTILLSTALPVVTGLFVITDILEDNDVTSAISGGIGALFTVGAQMFAWLTLVFALAERFHLRDRLLGRTAAWTPDDLLQNPRSHERVAGAYASAAWDVLLIGMTVWQHIVKPYNPDGRSEGLEVLDPALWSGWIWPVIAGLAGLAVLELARVAAHGWTVPLAAGYALATVVYALPLAWIVYQQKFFNPAFLAVVNKDWTVPGAVYTIAALGVLAVGVTDVVKRLREARG